MTTFEHWARRETEVSASKPESLGLWVEKRTLADLVLETVRGIEEESLSPVAASQAGVAFRSQVLLAVVTYCYAKGVYGSQEIESLMRDDNAFRFLCGNEYPAWRVIRNFRRQNREAIHRSLTATFKEAWSLKARGRVLNGPSPERNQTAFDRNRAALSPEQLSDEVEERIERAMFIDSMTQDEWTCP